MADILFSEKKEIIKSPKVIGPANTFENTARTESIDIQKIPEYEGIHSRASTVEDFLDIMHLALKGYQSYFVPAAPSTDTSLIYFPYAWYLNINDRVYNKTTGAEYFISTIESTIGENVVRLGSGTGSPMPEKDDVLLFDFDAIKSINFQQSYPNADDVNRYFTDDEITENSKGDFSDTISYRVKEMKPAKIDGVSQHSPRRMKSETDALTGSMKTTFLEQFDSMVSFQCWTKTNQNTSRFSRWFRMFMSRYRGVFKLNGVQEVIFIRQGSEFNVTRWRNDIVGTTLSYSVRTQEITHVLESQLKGFNSVLHLLNGNNEEQIMMSTNIERKMK